MVNQQLRIIVDENGVKSIDPLILSQMFVDAHLYEIDNAQLLVHDGADIIANYTIGDGLEPYNDLSNSLIATFKATEVVTLTESPKSSYKAEWILNDSDLITDRWFDVVWWKLNSPIQEFDVLAEKPELDQYRPIKQDADLIVTDDSDGTKIITDRLLDPSGFWNGSIVEIVTGANEGQNQRIESWDIETNTLTFVNSFDKSFSKDTKFKIKRSYLPEIASALTEINNIIQAWEPARKKGVNIAVNSYDFREMHLFLAIEKICSNLHRERDDPFDMWRAEYSNKFTEAQLNLRAKIDVDNNGVFSLESGDTERGGGSWMFH